jgi:acyl-CoA hydrolase
MSAGMPYRSSKARRQEAAPAPPLEISVPSTSNRTARIAFAPSTGKRFSHCESARPGRERLEAIGGQPDYALGSVHAVTSDGTLVIASASGSQLASYAWGAAAVIFVVGAQKLVPDLEAARERIVEHSLKLEDARAYAAYGQNSHIGKVLEIHQEDPGRIHVVLIRQPVGF